MGVLSLKGGNISILNVSIATSKCYSISINYVIRGRTQFVHLSVS